MTDIDRVKGLVIGLIICAIISLLWGCKTTRYVPVSSVRTEYKDWAVVVHDTVRDTVLKHSDTYRHDSVTVYVQGDTVYVDRWHMLMKVQTDKEKSRKSASAYGTAYTERQDSVGVPVPVERKVTKWERIGGTARDILAIVGIISMVCAIGLAVVRWLTKRRTER